VNAAWDVIIIGAGAAGLAAARDLVRGRRRILILEARDRAGGRLLTKNIEGCPIPVELGAEFIHGKAPETFALIQEHGLSVYDSWSKHYRFKNGRWVKDDTAWEHVDKVLGRLDRERKTDRSFEAFLKAHPRVSPDIRKAITAFVEGFQASEIDKIGERGLAVASQVGDDSGNFRIAQGYQALARAMQKALPPELVGWRWQTEVTRIEWVPHQVTVVTRSGERLAAPQAIVTLPIGVLKSGAVTFSPALPAEKTLALQRIEVGAVHRLGLFFAESFWESIAGDIGFIHSAINNFPTWWTALPFRVPLLTAWAGGGQAIRMGELSETEAIARALTTLAQFTGRSVPFLKKQLRGWGYHDWQQDPFARGAYSYLGVGGADASKHLGRPVADTLFFAGEATALHGRNGTVDGALSSGQRAALQVEKTKTHMRPNLG
jgi:monoamine oxidase